MIMAPFYFIGLLTCFTAFFATYGGFYYRTRPTPLAPEAYAHQDKTRELKTITVPIIRDGLIRGYISADFSIIGPETSPHPQNPEIDSYALDEAYRIIYTEADINFENIRKTDLNRLTSNIKIRVNARLHREALQDVLIRSFHYVSRDQAQN